MFFPLIFQCLGPNGSPGFNSVRRDKTFKIETNPKPVLSGTFGPLNLVTTHVSSCAMTYWFSSFGLEPPRSAAFPQNFSSFPVKGLSGNGKFGNWERKEMRVTMMGTAREGVGNVLKTSQDSPDPLADERSPIIHSDGPGGRGRGWSSSLRAPW